MGDTQSHIVVKANELVRRFGLTRATVADIAAALGMSPANIYKLFPSKDAIIEAVAEQGLAELKRTIEAAIASSPGALAGIDSLALAVFRGHNQHIRHGPQMFRAQIITRRDVEELTRHRYASAQPGRSAAIA